MRKTQLAFLIAVFGFFGTYAQHSVRGIVTDKTEPLIGVNVYEKGKTTGTTTDINGSYQLEVSSSTATLVFSFIGYQIQEITLSGQNTLDITLEESSIKLGDVLVVGSRSYERSSTDSPVPVDVIDVGELSTNTGRVEINQILQYAAPSFNATKQSGSDGADHIDPASLRGLGPDQTLVLVNGKRRHQSSLVNIFGTRGLGNTGTDLNAIPATAIKRIEVLRDGAAAQYGSDAIAGVINIVLDDTEGISGGVMYGAYSTAVGDGLAEGVNDFYGGEWLPYVANDEGTNRLDGKDKSYDGNTIRANLNYGAKLGNDGGFVNVTTEFLNRDKTLRPGFYWREGNGTAGLDQFQFMVNASMPLGENTEVYAFGGQGNRNGDAYAFTRGAPGAAADGGDDRTVAALYPNGFTPRITSRILDNSFTAGVKQNLGNDWKGDFSHSYGSNLFHYYIRETNNASLGSASPTEFDAGGHSLSMNVTSMDFSKFFKDVASGLNFAFGMEYRSENFEIFAGEEGSYATYDVNGVAITNPALQTAFSNEFGDQPSGGSQGFPGYNPDNEVDEYRTNIGVYADAEINLSEDFLLAGAIRFEEYSDFGNTFNYKLASKYSITDGLSLRASYSTGFRAPSLAQIHYNLLFNNVVGGTSVRTLLASNTSTVTKGFGIESLAQETSKNLAGGVSFNAGDFSATVDGYMINVDDRIILTDYFDASSLGVGAEAAQFFANGVDTKTSGVDIVTNYRLELTGDSELNIGLAGNINKTEIESINNGDLNEYTFYSPFSQSLLEASAPDFKFTFSTTYSSAKFDVSLLWTQYAEMTIADYQWVDYAPANQSEAEDLDLFNIGYDTYESVGTLDASITFKANDNLRFTVGGNNILNVYPTEQFDSWTLQGGFFDSVQMGTDGAFFFGRVGFNF